MNLSLSSFKIFTFFLLGAVLYFSCTKIVTTDIGAGLIPPVDGVTTKDTVLDVISKNAGFDTAYVGLSDDHVLGYVNDPIFGTTRASLNFQIAPTANPFSLGYNKDTVVLDSVVLCLSYHSAWGDTIPHLRLHVYEMDPEQVFSNDSAYKTTTTFEKAQELTSEFGAADVDITRLNDVDSTAFNKEPTTNQIRIRLNNLFGQQLINYDSASVYQNDSTFYNAVRGIIVEPEINPTSNALLRINLLDTATHLSLYYHTASRADTASRRFAPNVLSSASSNSIIRSYQNTQIPSYVSSNDSNQDLIFMQTNPGTYANINIRSVLGMPNAIIHRAEILMYQVPDLSSSNDKYLTPPNLFLSAINEDSGRRFVIPFDITFQSGAINNLYAFGVSPKTAPGGSSYYSFDISRYVQNIVTKGGKLFNLALTAPYNQYIFTDSTVTFAVPISSPALNTVGVGRVRLGGGTNSQYKMRLHIVYSPIK
ncbi:MAG: DUF4270 family protein [Parafilimonas sp.]|nr:DUF4270 family protein [Parafilimonas sp.]